MGGCLNFYFYFILTTWKNDIVLFKLDVITSKSFPLMNWPSNSLRWLFCATMTWKTVSEIDVNKNHMFQPSQIPHSIILLIVRRWFILEGCGGRLTLFCPDETRRINSKIIPLMSWPSDSLRWRFCAIYLWHEKLSLKFV